MPTRLATRGVIAGAMQIEIAAQNHAKHISDRTQGAQTEIRAAGKLAMRPS